MVFICSNYFFLFYFFKQKQKFHVFFLYISDFLIKFGGNYTEYNLLSSFTNDKKECTNCVIDNCRGHFNSCAANSRQQ